MVAADRSERFQMASYGYDSEYTGIRKFLNPQDPKVRIGLVVLLAVGSAYFLWSTVGTLFFANSETIVLSDDWSVFCIKCNAESVVSRSKYAASSDGSTATYPDCPKCGESKCCVDMTVCPKCGKLFASESAKALCAAAASGKTVDPYSFDLICPHCKHNLKEASDR